MKRIAEERQVDGCQNISTLFIYTYTFWQCSRSSWLEFESITVYHGKALHGVSPLNGSAFSDPGW